MKLRANFRGSTLSLVVGLLMIVSGITKARISDILVGLVPVIGGVIYKSAKKTRLGLVGSSRIRSALEGLGIIAIIGLLGRLALRYNGSTWTIIIPLWALVVYAVARLGTVSSENATAPTA
jgi:hypothetical protein